MMSRLIPACVLLVWLTVGPLTARATDPVRHALPAGARLLQEKPLPHSPAIYAVVYQAGGTHLGIVETARAGGRLIWERRLPGSMNTLSTPGPAGTFWTVSRLQPSTKAYFLAYSVAATQVRSAIEGHGSGQVSGDEGVAIQRSTVSVRSGDRQHVGSVKYRVVRTFTWRSGLYRLAATHRVPDYPAGAYPVPNGVVHTHAGDVVLIRLEIADTEQKRELGLMYRTSLDPDSGMVFVWGSPVLESFWMENTYVPLTVAFLGSDGAIQEMQDMAPLTTALHTPAAPYQFAIEVNQGFFAAHGIRAGDQVQLHLK